MMTSRNSGKPGEKPTVTDVTFGDANPDDEIFRTVHELRRTPKGRKYLTQAGISLKGYKDGNAGQYRSDVPFTERRFVAWDGESVRSNVRVDSVSNGGTVHEYVRSDSRYVLFGSSDGDYVHGTDLSTVECLSLITDTAHIDAIHFGFAFAYDVNMILRDLSKNHLKILRRDGKVRWRQWRIEYMPRKWFAVTDMRTGRTVKIWDVWSFFMCSALEAWKKYGVEVSETVIRGKLERGDLPYSKLWTDIFPYWDEENKAYVTLMEKLREALHAADLFISSWHGPGAIASHSLSKHRNDRSMAQAPKRVMEASQYAYGGGRFEMFKVGRAGIPVHEYDINSAYPFAISQLPNLAKGSWRRVLEPDRISRFGVYRISLRINPFDSISHLHRPMPFLHRSKRGTISFPCVNDTWVWAPELWRMRGFPGLTVHEGWVFEEETDERPFAWLAENYEIRRRYKEKGNPAQLALKLQMNSMYGKMAQRVGWNEERRTAPKWHQLEWAGWVTSYCRSMVFSAALRAGTDLVAFETDAVFTTKDISEHLDIGDGLGQWGATKYDDFVYLQSGCRFGLKGKEWEAKYRGFDKGSLSLDDALTVLAGDPAQWEIVGTTKRFVGFAQALHTDFGQWREFQSDKARVLRIGGEGKRRHNKRFCRSCRDGIPASESFHQAALAMPVPPNPHSEKHYLPWKDDALLETQMLHDDVIYEVVHP